MEGTGARLKKIRLDKGVSLEDAHKKTKIHLGILQAIEEDSLVNVSPVYIRGFLKIYCKFLEVDPREYIPQYKEPEYVVRKASSLDSHQKPVSLLKEGPSKLAFLNKINWKLFIKIVCLALGAILSILLILKVASAIISKIKNHPRKSRSAAVFIPAKKEVIPQEKVVEKVALEPSVIHFGILPKEDCLVNVKIDGRVVLNGKLKKGRLETWTANEKIELFLGNAGVVSLQIDGKTFTDLGRKGQALKNVVITKNGLVIKK